MRILSVILMHQWLNYLFSLVIFTLFLAHTVRYKLSPPEIPSIENDFFDVLVTLAAHPHNFIVSLQLLFKLVKFYLAVMIVLLCDLSVVLNSLLKMCYSDNSSPG